MFKKMLLVSAILATTTGIAFSNAAPYVGAGLGIVNNTTSSFPIASNRSTVFTQPSNFRGVPFNLLAGYGGLITQNFYLGGELFGTVGTAEISDNHGLKT